MKNGKQKGTCQICGRKFDTVANGAMPRHGFSTNGRMQSMECFGSRHDPYEKTSEAIAILIARIDRMKSQTEIKLQDQSISLDKRKGLESDIEWYAGETERLQKRFSEWKAE